MGGLGRGVGVERALLGSQESHPILNLTDHKIDKYPSIAYAAKI